MARHVGATEPDPAGGQVGSLAAARRPRIRQDQDRRGDSARMGAREAARTNPHRGTYRRRHPQGHDRGAKRPDVLLSTWGAAELPAVAWASHHLAERQYRVLFLSRRTRALARPAVCKVLGG